MKVYHQYFLFMSLLAVLFRPVWAQLPENPTKDKRFCEDKLQQEIQSLLNEDDGAILSDHYNLATLKLAYKLNKNQGQKQTLEAHIKKKIKDLNQADKSKLISKVKNLYKRFGQQLDEAEVAKIIDDLDEHNYFPKSERLSNKESSVVMLAYEMLEPCKGGVTCINNNDAAIVWFMDKVGKQVEKDTNSSKLGNLLHTSVKIAHNTGVFNNTEALKPEEIKNSLKKLQRQIHQRIKSFNERFKQKFKNCVEVLGGAACFARKVEQQFQLNLNDILAELNQEKISKVPGKLKVKLTKGLTLNLSENLQFHKKDPPPAKKDKGYPKKLNLPPEIVDGDDPISCGGKTFEAETRLKNIISFDPLRLYDNIKGFKKPWKEANRIIERRNKAIDHKAARGNKGAKLMSFFNKLCPKIPISVGIFSFKCSPFMKWLVLKRTLAETKVCCRDKMQWKDFNMLYAGSTGGIEGKVFLGIPYIAEFGGVVGVAGTLNLGGGGIPEGCSDKKCVQLMFLLSAYGGLYVDIGLKDIMKNAVGGEAKISWKPYVTGRQCLDPAGNLPPAEVKLSMGSIWFNGTVYAGWVFTYDFYKKVWESKKEDTFDLAIF